MIANNVRFYWEDSSVCFYLWEIEIRFPCVIWNHCLWQQINKWLLWIMIPNWSHWYSECLSFAIATCFCGMIDFSFWYAAEANTFYFVLCFLSAAQSTRKSCTVPLGLSTREADVFREHIKANENCTLKLLPPFISKFTPSLHYCLSSSDLVRTCFWRQKP